MRPMPAETGGHHDSLAPTAWARGQEGKGLGRSLQGARVSSQVFLVLTPHDTEQKRGVLRPRRAD